MAKNKKNISWTPIIIIAMVLVFILILAFVFGNHDSNNYSQNSKDTQNIISQNSETMTLSGMNEVKTINYPVGSVNLVISGLNNIITVTKKTQVSQITLSGQGNQIFLCSGIHSPKIVDSGLNNKINYKNC